MSAITTIEAAEVVQVDDFVEAPKSKFPNWLPAVIVLAAVVIGAIWFSVTQYQFHMESEQLHEHAIQIMQDFYAKHPNANPKP